MAVAATRSLRCSSRAAATAVPDSLWLTMARPLSFCSVAREGGNMGVGKADASPADMTAD